MFCQRIWSDEVRARIAPASIACEHIRPAFFDRAIVAVPMHVTIGPRGHCAPRGLVSLDRLYIEDHSGKSNDSG